MSERGTASRYLSRFQSNFSYYVYLNLLLGKSDYDVLITRMIPAMGLWSSRVIQLSGFKVGVGVKSL